jgi:hypothetical protein
MSAANFFYFVIPGTKGAMVSKLDEQVVTRSRDDIYS